MTDIQLFRLALEGWSVASVLRAPGEDVVLPDPSSDPEAPSTYSTWTLEYPGEIETPLGNFSEARVTFGGTRERRGYLVIGLWVQSVTNAEAELDAMKADALTFIRSMAIEDFQILGDFVAQGAPVRLAGWYGSPELLRVPWVTWEEPS